CHDNPLGRGYFFNGIIDDVRVYNRALSAEEIEELYPEGGGPIAHWKFDEGAGTTAYDSAGDNDGAIYGATWTGGQIGGALSFDGVDDYVDVGDRPSLDFGAADSFTISAWIRCIGAGQQSIVGKRDHDGNAWQEGYRFEIYLNKLYFVIEDTSDVGVEIFGNSAVGGDWHHVVACRDTVEDKLYVYVDGGSDATPVVDTTIASLSGNEPFTIGRSHGGIHFDGTIDDVRVYNRALSAEEIEELYTEGGGPIAHWKFDEGEGITAYDSAGDNDGTIYGANWTDGQIGGALDFDGVDDYVDIGCQLIGEVDDSFTAMAWFKLAAGFDQDLPQTVLWQSGILGLRAYKRGVITADCLISGGWLTLSSGVTPVADTWYLVAETYDAEDDILKVYVNGDEENSTVCVPLKRSEHSLLLGVQTGDPHGNYMDGAIDDVRIYNRALSAEEIEQIYEEGLPGVAVDIRPESCPNPLNLKSSGILPVAVLGAEDFDVYDIDPVSVRLAGVAAIRHGYEDAAGPVVDGNECECTTEGSDGYDDLTLKFRTREIVRELIDAPGELAKGQTIALTLTGVLFDGKAIHGADCVVLVGNVPRWLAALRWDANADGIVNMRDFAEFANYWLESSDAQ
ncbi:MAG: LamG domain-containing protein, partial [Planctomycetota bacterium]